MTKTVKRVFAREYIAMLFEERKTHLKIFAGLVTLNILMVLIYHFSMVL